MLLGLLNGKLDAEPTTVYLMTYTEGKCTANCGFCPQARKSRGRTDMLSRVSWPPFSLEEALNRIVRATADGTIKRVCIQALNYPEVFTHLLALVKMISQHVKVPISISCQPLSRENIQQLAEAGLERIGIALDAATEELFERVKGRLAEGPYTWRKQFKLLNEAVEIFGRSKVSTHLIVGLGEAEKEMVKTIQKCVDMGVLPALFAFTPIHGTALENHPQPQVEKYRRIQLARYLIVNGISRYEYMNFDADGCISDFGAEKEKLMQAIKTGKPFLTSGCPDCNRPYYNEKPSGPIYNYPRNIRQEELVEIEKELSLCGA
jgi:biotin synthase